MKNIKTLFNAAGLLSVFCGAAVWAASATTAFTYQGRLLDDNVAADGLYDMQFALYDDPNVLIGTQVGSTIAADDVDVVDGYFVAELDFGSNVYGDQARWLQVTVRPGASTDPADFVSLSPLQKLTAAPYANSAYEVTGRIRTPEIYEGFLYNYDTWTPKEANRGWRSVAMSDDGTIQTAAAEGNQVYISTDSGNTWTPKVGLATWQSVAMSADGSIQTVVADGGYIHVSTDTGINWTNKGPIASWRSVAVSDNGSVQTAVIGGLGTDQQIWISTDSGNTWTSKESSRDWRSVAMSADGTIQTALVRQGQIYVSTDTGNTWTPRESSRNWWSVAMSNDGSIQTAVVYAGQIYVSTDYGNTWAPKESNRNWFSVAMSDDGTIQAAVVLNGQLYISTDSGNTWTPKESARAWVSVAMSADAGVLTALDSGGQIYISVEEKKIGIGTKNPSEKLHVNGKVKADAFIGDGKGLTNVNNWTESAGNVYRASGNVGIGTTSPTATLDVNGDIKADNIFRLVDLKTVTGAWYNYTFSGLGGAKLYKLVYIGKMTSSPSTASKDIFIQVGDSSGLKTSGYTSSFHMDEIGYGSTSGSSTDGFYLKAYIDDWNNISTEGSWEYTLVMNDSGTGCDGCGNSSFLQPTALGQKHTRCLGTGTYIGSMSIDQIQVTMENTSCNGTLMLYELK